MYRADNSSTVDEVIMECDFMWAGQQVTISQQRVPQSCQPSLFTHCQQSSLAVEQGALHLEGFSCYRTGNQIDILKKASKR